MFFRADYQKSKCCRFLFVGLFLQFTFFSGVGFANDVVIWRTTDWAPLYIVAGKNKGTGLYDRMISKFKLALPNFYHLDVKMTTTRALEQMALMKTGVATCHVSMVKRQAVGKAEISDLNSILLTHEVIYRRELSGKFRKLLNDRNEISITDLVEESDLVGGIASFGTHAELENYAEEHPDHIIHIPEAYETLLQMLLNGRIDYLIQYRPVIEHAEKIRSLTGSTLFAKITETLNQPIVKVYAACSKNSVGKQVIARINHVLKKMKKDGSLLDLQLSVYSNLNDKSVLRAHYDDYYKSGD